jgi:hypothetical protein
MRRECCFNPDSLRVWIFDHPRLHRLWDTKALNAQHARLNFKREWERQAADGRLKTAGLRKATQPAFVPGKAVDPSNATFLLGKVRLDEGQDPPAVPADAFGDDMIPGEPDETWESEP